MIAAFLQWLASNGRGPKKFVTCLHGNERDEHALCLVRTLVISYNDSTVELALRLSAATIVAAISNRHPTWHHKRAHYSSIDRVRLLHYTAGMDIRHVHLPSFC